MDAEPGREYVLTLSCPDKPGIVYAVAEAGRDVEAQVLARAVTWHAEHRVLLNDDRTVVFH
jgi:formyltetrahydrofolate hydrolase